MSEERSKYVKLCFSFHCRRQWDELSETDDSSIHFCHRCKKNVYFCSTDEELIMHSQMKECVAVAVTKNDDPTSEPLIMLGEIICPEPDDKTGYGPKNRGIVQNLVSGLLSILIFCETCLNKLLRK